MSEPTIARENTTRTVILPSIFATLLGAIVVAITSPTISASSLLVASIYARTTLDNLLLAHALIADLTFTFLISFFLLCNYGPTARWIARNQSFPYSYAPSWNFGPKSLDFQLLIFEIFHIGRASRWIHMLGIVFEEGLWAMVIHLTFGQSGLLVLSIILASQGITYRNIWLGCGVAVANAMVIGACWCLVEGLLIGTYDMDYISVTSMIKGLLFWTVTIRTLSHILEPLPPTYRPEVECFDNNFGVVGWRLCISDLPRAMWLVILGNVSEFGAGMPGRLFNVVVYKGMYTAGFRNATGLLDVVEAKRQAHEVIEMGWMAHAETEKMYCWALDGRAGLLHGDDEKDVNVGIGEKPEGAEVDLLV